MRTHERGSGETAACGSGACAAAVVAHALGWTARTVVLEQPGGRLEVELRPGGIVLRGPARVGSDVSFELGG